MKVTDICDYIQEVHLFVIRKSLCILLFFVGVNGLCVNKTPLSKV